MNIDNLIEERNRILKLHSKNPIFACDSSEFIGKCYRLYHEEEITNQQLRYLVYTIENKNDGITTDGLNFINKVIDRYRVKTNTFYFLSEIGGEYLAPFNKLCVRLKDTIENYSMNINFVSFENKLKLELDTLELLINNKDEYGVGYDVILRLRVIWGRIFYRTNLYELMRDYLDRYLDLLERYFKLKEDEVKELLEVNKSVRISLNDLNKIEIDFIKKFKELDYDRDYLTIGTANLARKSEHDFEDFLEIIDARLSPYTVTNNSLVSDFNIMTSRLNDYWFYISNANYFYILKIVDFFTIAFSKENVLGTLKTMMKVEFLDNERNDYHSYLKRMSTRYSEFVSLGLCSKENIKENFYYLVDHKEYDINKELITYFLLQALDNIDRMVNVELTYDIYDTKRVSIDYDSIYK